jgi:hypothetical protein
MLCCWLASVTFDHNFTSFFTVHFTQTSTFNGIYIFYLAWKRNLLYLRMKLFIHSDYTCSFECFRTESTRCIFKLFVWERRFNIKWFVNRIKEFSYWKAKIPKITADLKWLITLCSVSERISQNFVNLVIWIISCDRMLYIWVYKNLSYKISINPLGQNSTCMSAFCIRAFHMILTANSDYFLKER